METDLKKEFQLSTEVSNDCYNCASDLNAAARILYAVQGDSKGYPTERLGLLSNFNFQIALSRPALMNAGFALELILKACLIRTKKFDPKKHFKHDLLKLSLDAEIPYTSDQKHTLRILTDSTTWFGRYPHPKTLDDLQKNESNWKSLQKIENFGSIKVISSDENRWPIFQNYSELWRMAHNQYWNIEPKDPRESRQETPKN